MKTWRNNTKKLMKSLKNRHVNVNLIVLSYKNFKRRFSATSLTILAPRWT